MDLSAAVLPAHGVPTAEIELTVLLVEDEASEDGAEEDGLPVIEADIEDVGLAVAEVTFADVGVVTTLEVVLTADVGMVVTLVVRIGGSETVVDNKL